MKRLYETIDRETFFTDFGIFLAIQESETNPFTWLTDSIAKLLDAEYYFNHSNEKWISPLYDNLIDISENDPTVINYLAGLITNKFKDKWNRLYDAFVTKTYNPIENYSMVEKTEINTDIETANNVYGFNSSSPVPSNNAKTTGNKLNNTTDHTRSGNIGVTTSQQMLESEIKLREWNFYDQLFKDVDSILCLQLY